VDGAEGGGEEGPGDVGEGLVDVDVRMTRGEEVDMNLCKPLVVDQPPSEEEEGAVLILGAVVCLEVENGRAVGAWLRENAVEVEVEEGDDVVLPHGGPVLVGEEEIGGLATVVADAVNEDVVEAEGGEALRNGVDRRDLTTSGIQREVGRTGGRWRSRHVPGCTRNARRSGGTDLAVCGTVYDDAFVLPRAPKGLHLAVVVGLTLVGLVLEVLVVVGRGCIALLLEKNEMEKNASGHGSVPSRNARRSKTVPGCLRGASDG